jgi:AcrR family transcriptional regulator
MTSRVDNGSTVASPRRRHDAQASRDALLQAAAALFDERGYDAATLRDIGERAGVDPALIARYFGSKDGLYLAALQHEDRPAMPTDPSQMLEFMFSNSEQRGIGPIPLAVVSPTLGDVLRQQVGDIVGRRAVAPLAAELASRGVADPRLRAEILIAIATGLLLTRAGGTLPALSRVPLDELLAVLEPLVDALQQRPG